MRSEAFRENNLRKNSEREQLAELMKKILLGTFYTLQGLGNLILGLFFPFTGSRGQIAWAIDVFIRPSILFVSCLSLFIALTLFLPRARELSRVLGIVTTVLFGFFYGWMALISYSEIVRHYSSYAAIVLLISLIIVILNAVSFFFLYKLTNNK
jgi:hypothetical protein